MKYRRQADARSGFTIVELLIVVVIIAILATITVVAYQGITQSANDAAVKSDVRQIGERLLRGKAETDTLPTLANNNAGPGFRYAVNRSAYYSGINNLYICKSNDNPNDSIGIAARSVSGTIFAWRDGSFIDYSGSFSASTDICPALGFPAPFGYTNGSGAVGGWAAWTAS